MNSIGEGIRLLRTKRRMTLAELGEKTNLSTSHLSQIERDRTTPSLSTLMSVAKALDVGLRYFFETESEAAHVVRADEGQDALVSDRAAMRLRLTPEAGNNKLEAYRTILQPQASCEPLPPYTGEELAFVLAGELTILVGDERFVLGAGDSIHYDALLPCSWSNEGDQPCVVIWGRSAS